MDDLEWMQECEKRVEEACREALERAAKVCEAKRAEWAEDAHPHDTSAAACGDCAYAIRALIERGE